MSKFNCIIVDPDTTSRMKLKQATSQISGFSAAQTSSSLKDAAQTLKSGVREFDIVFLSTQFDSAETISFISSSKQTKVGQDAAYVMILKSLPQDNSLVAEQMIQGGDGVLCEPYSVESLAEISALATRIRKERSDAREKIAIQMLVSDFIRQIDTLASLRTSGMEPGVHIKKARDLSAIVRNLNPEMRQYYFDLLLTEFPAVRPPSVSASAKIYAGASARVRKKLEEKVRAEIGGK